ncbi:MAG: ATP-binding protein [Pyrobaculum sp.]
MAGEDLPLAEVEMMDFGEDFKIALSRVHDGGNVYIVGPAGSGKSAMLRKIGVYVSRLGLQGVYVKLEWVKYGWGLADYLRRYGEKSRELTGLEYGERPGLVLLDDGELLWSYGSAYKNLVRDIGGSQVVGAFREIDVDSATLLFGDGLIIYLQGRPSQTPVVKTPLGFSFIGKTTEVVVI